MINKRHGKKKIYFAVFWYFLWIGAAFGQNNVEVYLKNGDRITGEILNENDNNITVSSGMLGELEIKKENVDRVISQEDKIKEAEKKKTDTEKWKRRVSLGYTQTKGNTQKSTLAMSAAADRVREMDEVNMKGNLFYSTSEEKMDAQTWYTMGKYSYKLFNKKLYLFGKCEVDHDRFANIDYRALPGGGLGYHFYNTDDFKLLGELGGGYSHTHFRDETPDRNEAVLIPRMFTQKKLIWGMLLSEDLTFYPSLSETGGYRCRSETVFSAPIRNGLAVKMSVIDDYNSKPAEGAKSNDIMLISALEYLF